MRSPLGPLVLAAACSRHPEIALEPVPAVELGALDARTADRIRERQAAGDPGALGMVYHAYDLVPAALACYRNAARFAPDDHRWPYYSALLLAEGGDLDDARAAFATAKALMDRDPQTAADQRIALLCRLGDLEIEAGDFARARQHFEQALVLRPACAPALLGVGRCDLETDQPGHALEPLKQAAKLLPYASNAHYLLGTAYRRVGESRLAESHLRRADEPDCAPASAADPLAEEVRVLADSAYRHRHLGARYFQAGRFDAAAAELRKAVDAKPDDLVSRTNLAAALARLGWREKAEVELSAVLAADPDALLARFDLGVLRAQAGDDAGAAEQYERVLAIDPSHRMARFNLANALGRLGRLDTARGHYARVIEADPANGPARLGEARMMILLGSHGEAKARLESACREVPGYVDLAHELARLLVTSPDDSVRDPARGLAIAEGILRGNREVVYAATVAMGRAATGDFDGAIALQQEAITAARAARRPDLVACLERDLALYRSGDPRRTPWHREELR